MSNNTELYDEDFFKWTQTTASLLRTSSFAEVNIASVAEEIEDLGKRDLREVNSRTRVLLMHLLKWQCQPGKQSPSWRATISTERLEIEQVFDQSPSLRRKMKLHLAKTYVRARFEAAAETGLPEKLFPSICPYTVEQILDRSFFPG